jgi:hypothetical protein
MTPKETIREFGKQLEKRGITDFSYSDSQTDFGNSSYLMVGPFKVRASDHSVTSVGRIMDEIHLHPLTWNNSLNTIERYYYPNRFEKVTEYEYGGVHEVPSDTIESIIMSSSFEIKIIDSDFRKTKKGRFMTKIQRKNVPTTSFIPVN